MRTKQIFLALAVVAVLSLAAPQAQSQVISGGYVGVQTPGFSIGVGAPFVAPAAVVAPAPVVAPYGAYMAPYPAVVVPRPVVYGPRAYYGPGPGWGYGPRFYGPRYYRHGYRRWW